MKPMVFSISNEILIMDGKTYRAVSGPYGKGALPNGSYQVLELVDLDITEKSKPYCIGDICFWIPLIPDIETARTGLGIHPDGNVKGSLGCIAIESEDDCVLFRCYFKKLNPEKLIVVD